MERKNLSIFIFLGIPRIKQVVNRDEFIDKGRV